MEGSFRREKRFDNITYSETPLLVVDEHPGHARDVADNSTPCRNSVHFLGKGGGVTRQNRRGST
jgi:hypothetical protein